MKNNIIYLTGFMGSGKSTIGPILANTLGWDFYDLDLVIENKLGKKITDIFNEDGEKYFRQVENETFKELSFGENVIISLGGGTIANQGNIDYFKSHGKIIYLKISPEEAYERLKFKRDRPVLINNGTIDLTKNDFIRKLNDLLNSRKHYYEQADFTVDANNLAIGKTVDKIARLILKGKVFDSF
ncbi:MAG: shikimate kinase [Ignavibacteriaceae bacterium]